MWQPWTFLSVSFVFCFVNGLFYDGAFCFIFGFRDIIYKWWVEHYFILFSFKFHYYVFTQYIFLISKQVFYMYNELRKMVSAILTS